MVTRRQPSKNMSGEAGSKNKGKGQDSALAELQSFMKAETQCIRGRKMRKNSKNWVQKFDFYTKS